MGGCTEAASENCPGYGSSCSTYKRAYERDLAAHTRLMLIAHGHGVSRKVKNKNKSASAPSCAKLVLTS